MMYVKVHEVFQGGIYEKIVAVCDANILGKTLESEGAKVFINPRFYKGEKAGEERILKELEHATTTNFFGEEAVQIGVKAGLIEKNNVILFQGVPHAQTAKII